MCIRDRYKSPMEWTLHYDRNVARINANIQNRWAAQGIARHVDWQEIEEETVEYDNEEQDNMSVASSTYHF